MTTKKCFKCKRLKPIYHFYKHPQTADGYLGKCKCCTKKDASIVYFSNKEYYQNYEKERNQRSERKMARKIYQQRRREKCKGKYRANQKVSNAVRDGRIIKQPCEICGDQKVEAHHKDYRKYLDVQWLCFKHHRELHKSL